MHRRSGFTLIERLCVNRHGGAQYCLLADWSVRNASLKQLWRLKWHRTYDVDALQPVWPQWMAAFREEF